MSSVSTLSLLILYQVFLLVVILQVSPCFLFLTEFRFPLLACQLQSNISVQTQHMPIVLAGDQLDRVLLAGTYGYSWTVTVGYYRKKPSVSLTCIHLERFHNYPLHYSTSEVSSLLVALNSFEMINHACTNESDKCHI